MHQTNVTFMKKFYSILMLFILIINSAEATTRRYRLMFNDDPSTTVTIAWDQASGTNPVLYYGPVDFGTSFASYPNSSAPFASTTSMGMSNQFVKLTGLTPNTAYYFVINDSQGTSQRYWFKTCPNVNTEQLSFVSGGDSRSGQTQRINSNKMVAKIRPHAVLFGGDLVDVPSNSSFQMWMDDLQYAITSDNQIIPFVHSYGNHEASGTGGAYILRDLFNVTDDAYYKVTFGGNLFSVYTLNGELLPGHTIPNATKRTAMKNWLASTLAADNAIWKSAQYHRPIVPHEAGKGEGADEHNDWAQNFYDYGVRLVMESDAHVVKITDEVRPVNPVASGNSSTWFTSSGIAANKGITFIGEGSWGTLRNPDDLHPMTVASGEFYQFSWIIVNTCSIQVRTIDTQNPNSVPEHTPTDLFSISSALDALIWKPTGVPSGVVEIINCSAPIADFTGVPTNIFTGQTVNFTDLSTNTPTTWSWNFGGGGTPNTSTLQNPSIVFNTVGSYTVTLTATNADGSDAETKTAYINVTTPVAPVANFSADDVTPTVSQNVTFTDLSTGNPTSWSWNFGDGNNSTLQNPVHAYTAGGTYTVTLTATNGVGNDAEVKTNYITVSTGGSISVAISNGSDDVEEYNTDGTLYTNSSDLEFCYDGSAGNQHVGLRFQGVNIPQGAIITNAYIQMRADETDNTNLDVFIAGHDADNSAAWSGSYAVSGRTKTSATTTWVHNGTTAWTADVTIAQTPSLSAMVEEIVNRPGWSSGNAMSFIFWDNNSDQDERVADPIEGGYAPILFVDYTMPTLPTPPVANFSSSTNTICAGSNVDFTDVSTNTPTSWSWNFGDGNTSTLQNPTNTYLFPGTYTVTLTATNSGGSNLITQSNLITVVALPNVTASSSISICSGSSTTISATGATTYTWDNGLGVGASHSVSPTTPTTYSVTGTQNGCSNSDIVTIAVDSPNNSGTANAITVCQSSTSIDLFTALVGEDAGGSWNDDESTGALTGNSINATLLSIGNTYDFTYLVPANGACAAVQTTTQVLVSGTVNAGTPTSNNSGCTNDNAFDLFNTISGFTSGGTWNDDEATGLLSGNILDASSLSAGIYDFTYSVGGGACGTDAQTISVTINNVPTVDAGLGTAICEGESVNLSATGATSFNWDNGLGNGSTHSVAPMNTTTYTVTGTTNGCSAQDDVTITVNTLPTVTMDPFGVTSLCEQENSITLPEGYPVGGTYSGNGVSGTNFDPAVAGIGIHTIIYSYADGNNCTNTAQQNIEVTNCLNVFEGQNLVFKIYPNPANDFILIERSDASDYSHVVITDITGKVVYDKVVYENPLEIKVNQWSNGVYTVKFVNKENKTITQKIIIQK